MTKIPEVEECMVNEACCMGGDLVVLGFASAWNLVLIWKQNPLCLYFEVFLCSLLVPKHQVSLIYLHVHLDFPSLARTLRGHATVSC